MTSSDERPPMDPSSSEADEKQLSLAKAQGDAYQRALRHMAQDVASTGGTSRAGDYIVGYAIEDAEGMYEYVGGELVWNNPGDTNAHIEIAVCDGSDGRFVPGLDVDLTLVHEDGKHYGPVRLPLLWHPMIYHYGADVRLDRDGKYTLKAHIGPATFGRHDEINGRRFIEPVDVEFESGPIKRGAEPVTPPS